MASANASAESSIASMNTVSELSNNATDILQDVQDLENSISQTEAEVLAANSINEETRRDRDTAVSAVEQLRAKLNDLDLIDSSTLDEVRQLVSQTRNKYEAADLSGIYRTLTSRLEEQRNIRNQLQEELDGLTGDIEHLRRVNEALPDPSSGCGEGA